MFGFPVQPLELKVRPLSRLPPLLLLVTPSICSSYAPSCKKRFQFIFELGKGRTTRKKKEGGGR